MGADIGMCLLDGLGVESVILLWWLVDLGLVADLMSWREPSIVSLSVRVCVRLYVCVCVCVCLTASPP